VKHGHSFRRFFKTWRAIPDNYGRRLRFAQPAEKGECTTLLTTNYKPDVAKTWMSRSENGDFEFLSKLDHACVVTADD